MVEEGLSKCALAIKEAIKKAIQIAGEEIQDTICSTEDYDRALKEVLAELLGVEVNPTSCDLVLSTITESTCKDFYKQREYVMCRAHQLMKEWREEGKIADLGKAIREAWDDLKTKCLEKGIVV